MRANKPVTVTLGKERQGLDRRVASGAYESASEVVRAALRALDREEQMLDEILRRKIQEALDDPRPGILADDVFARLELEHAERMKAAKRGA